jgi:hypothetical protein
MQAFTAPPIASSLAVAWREHYDGYSHGSGHSLIALLTLQLVLAGLPWLPYLAESQRVILNRGHGVSNNLDRDAQEMTVANARTGRS